MRSFPLDSELRAILVGEETGEEGRRGLEITGCLRGGERPSRGWGKTAIIRFPQTGSHPVRRHIGRERSTDLRVAMILCGIVPGSAPCPNPIVATDLRGWPQQAPPWPMKFGDQLKIIGQGHCLQSTHTEPLWH